MSWLLLQHELRLAARRPMDAGLPLAFLVLAACLFPLGLGPEPEQLRQMAPGVLWVLALLASLLSLHQLYATDAQDGSLDQLLLAPHSAWRLAAVKALAHWLSQALPLLLTTPLLGLMFGMRADSLGVLLAGLLLGTPTLSLLGNLAAALTLGLRHAALLNLLIVLPLAIPTLIFGSGAIAAFESGVPVAAHFSLLAALLLASILALPAATAAALRISLI